MSALLDPVLMVVLLLNLFVLGTSRIKAIIHAVAIEGVLLGLLPLFVFHKLGWRTLVVTTVTLGLKGVIIPGMLRRAMRDVAIRREVEPLIGLAPSMVLGAVAVVLVMVLTRRLPLLHEHADLLLVPAALATVLTGFLLLTSRLKAITQVLGYLVLENGIYIFGLTLLEAIQFLVELGVLLDLFVCIFVMGIMLNHIHREFSSLSTERLTSLKD